MSVGTKALFFGRFELRQKILTVSAKNDTDFAKLDTNRKKCVMITPTTKTKEEPLMKTKLHKVLFALMLALAGIVQCAAALAAGGASFASSYQPKVPERLRR